MRSARSRSRDFVTLGALSLALAACGSTDLSPTPAPSSSLNLTAPVIDGDFPDPDVVAVDGRWLAFATGTPGLNIRVASSPDLEHWTVERRDALPTLPEWASAGRTWAPDVSQRVDGTWVMYVTAEHTDSGRQCIGVATGETADGTFTPVGGEPLVCPVDEGGAIDPSTLTDVDGVRYLLWKTDGNCCSLDTWIEISRLSDDGLSLVGETTRLIRQDQRWEGDLVEAPTMLLRNHRYVLLYSANGYGGGQVRRRCSSSSGDGAARALYEAPRPGAVDGQFRRCPARARWPGRRHVQQRRRDVVPCMGRALHVPRAAPGAARLGRRRMARPTPAPGEGMSDRA